MGLNPYCIGSSNHAGANIPIAALTVVLILIVLDHLIMLVDKDIFERTYEEGLNPYCIGSSNHAT